MERPKAIIWFARCYLGAFVIKLMLAIVNWDKVDSATTQIGTTIALLLWFGVVYRHSNVSRWIIVIYTIIGAIWTCIIAASGTYDWATNILMVVALILNLGAALQLINAEAESWFKKLATDASA